MTSIPLTPPRELWEWGEKDGRRVRTVRRRDEVTGVDISAVDAVVASPLVGVQRGVLEVPDAVAAQLSVGVYAVVSGTRQTLEFSTRKDSYEVLVTVSGVENATVIGTFTHQPVKAGAK